MKLVLALILFPLTLNLAAAEERNYAELLGDGVPFTIPLSGASTFQDDGSNPYMRINRNNGREEFTYRVGNMTTPRRGFSLNVFNAFQRQDYRLNVDRNTQRLQRMSHVTFSEAESGQKTHHAQTVAFNEAGFIDSFTYCYENYRDGFWGMRSNRSGHYCMTINQETCAYMESQNIDDALVTKINECSMTFQQMAGHQETLRRMNTAKHNDDIRAINRANGGRLNDAKNFYEFNATNLQQFTELANGYQGALAKCRELKDANYFPPEPELPRSSGGSEGEGSSERRQSSEEEAGARSI